MRKKPNRRSRHQPAAFRDDILATPLLVRTYPKPHMTVIGSLSDPACVLRALDAVQEETASSSVRFVQSAGEA